MIRVSLSLFLRAACLGTAALCFAGPASAQLARKEQNLANDPAWIKKTALEIDKRLAGGFAKQAVKPLPAADDARLGDLCRRAAHSRPRTSRGRGGRSEWRGRRRVCPNAARHHSHECERARRAGRRAR